MILKQLIITRKEKWQDPVMPLQGKAEFAGPKGEITIPLNEVTSQRIVELVSQQLVDSAREVAQLIAADVYSQVPALEHKE